MTDAIEFKTTATKKLSENVSLKKGILGRRKAGEQIPYVVLSPAKPNGTAVLWIDAGGKSHLFNKQGQPNPAVQKLLDAGITVGSADVFRTGVYLPEGETVETPKVNERYHGYTFGYNRPVLSNRVRDVLTALRGLVDSKTKSIHLVGTGGAGPWVLLARAVSPIPVDRTVADLGGISFSDVADVNDPMFLPGALKYGGIGGLAALASPASMTVAGIKAVPEAELQPLVKANAASRGKLELEQDGLSPETVVAKLLK